MIVILGERDETGTYKVTGFKALAIPLSWFLYFPVCESIFGQTIGKKAFDLYAVDLKGESPTIVQSFLRRCLDLVELSILGIPGLIAINHSEKKPTTWRYDGRNNGDKNYRHLLALQFFARPFCQRSNSWWFCLSKL